MGAGLFLGRLSLSLVTYTAYVVGMVFVCTHQFQAAPVLLVMRSEIQLTGTKAASQHSTSPAKVVISEWALCNFLILIFGVLI
jgi:hypothetical protein